MFGELGYKPYEYYCLLPRELNDILEGYHNKKVRESAELRRATYISMLPHVDARKLSFQKFCKDFWALDIDDIPNVDTETLKEISKRDFKSILQTHNKLISQGRRKKDLNK